MKIERKVAASAKSADGNIHITVLRSYRNFITWYDVEVDRWKGNCVSVSSRNDLDLDQAFDYFESFVNRNNLIVKEV